MRASEFAQPDALPLAGSRQRNWLLLGLLLSLLLHAGLCFFFYRTEFQTIAPPAARRAQTATFKVKNVDPAPKPVEKPIVEQAAPAAKPEPQPSEVQLPDEKKSFDKLLEEVHASAAMPNDTSDVLPDKPKVEQNNTSSVLNEIERTTAQTLARNPNAPREQSLLSDAANSGRPQPVLTGTELATSTTVKRPNNFTSTIPRDSAGPVVGRGGFSDLDQLLSQRGPIGSGTSIRMPDDQLFDYNLADLQTSAVQQLQKLSTLIKRNPNAKFRIEGYTDAIGSDEYNLDLSQRRADSVKAYLVSELGVNPAQVDARGFGKSKFLVPPRPSADLSEAELQAEIKRQQPNRRVVIVVDTKNG